MIELNRTIPSKHLHSTKATHLCDSISTVFELHWNPYPLTQFGGQQQHSKGLQEMGHSLKKLGYFPYNMNLNELPWNREPRGISTYLPFQNNNKTHHHLQKCQTGQDMPIVFHDDSWKLAWAPLYLYTNDIKLSIKAQPICLLQGTNQTSKASIWIEPDIRHQQNQHRSHVSVFFRIDVFFGTPLVGARLANSPGSSAQWRRCDEWRAWNNFERQLLNP